MARKITFTVPEGHKSEFLGQTFTSIGGPYTLIITDEEFQYLQNLIADENIIISENKVLSDYSLKIRDNGILHRNNISVADKIVIPEVFIEIADQPSVDGLLTAVEHGVSVAPGNDYGSAGASTIITVTPTVNKSVDLTISQAVGAIYYDIFFSTETEGPKWIARITEAQRAAGCAITDVGVIGEGGSEGVVNIGAIGTGAACTEELFTKNNAFILDGIIPINAENKSMAYVYIDHNVTDFRVVPSVIPKLFLLNQITGKYHNAAMELLIPIHPLESLRQVFVTRIDGSPNILVAIDEIVGNGSIVDICVEMV